MSASKKDPLVAAKEQAARFSFEQERLDAEVKKILGFEGAPSSEREKEVLALKAKRMGLTTRLEYCLNQINSSRRGAISLTKEQLKDLDQRKKDLLAQLNELPDLGVTMAEWAALDPELKTKGVGRPAVSLEQRIIRATNGFQASMELIKEISGEVNIDEIIAMAQDSKVVEKKDGRPKHDMIGVMDAKLKTVRSKIEYITSGDAQRHIDERIKNSIYSESGKRLGRSFEDPNVKLARLREEESNILALIEKQESRLQGVEKIQRMLKLRRDERTSLQRAIDATSNAEEKALLEKEYSEVIAAILDLEVQIRALKDPSSTKMRPRNARDYVQPDVTALVQKPSSIVRQVVTAVRDTAPKTVERITQASNDHQKIHDERLDDNRKNSENVAAVQKSSQETRDRVSRLLSSKNAG
ncbi:hypothetical protein RYA05_05195 [Pseudomonas syringae pv. actinidiae]|nr:hypothetical protein [Pseudomonas syringae pv. actinidiae]